MSPPPRTLGRLINRSGQCKAERNTPADAGKTSARPVLVVMVEIGFIGAFGDAVESVEQGEYIRLNIIIGGFFFLQQIVDEVFGMDFFLNVNWQRVDHQIGAVLRVFSFPDEPRI